LLTCFVVLFRRLIGLRRISCPHDVLPLFPCQTAHVELEDPGGAAHLVLRSMVKAGVLKRMESVKHLPIKITRAFKGP
jgi:hypothetical protein